MEHLINLFSHEDIVSMVVMIVFMLAVVGLAAGMVFTIAYFKKDVQFFDSLRKDFGSWK